MGAPAGLIVSRPATPHLEDCHFYHVMDLPGYGPVGDDWDLRLGVDAYLGHVEMAGERILEIGPASGYLTFEMERRGAEVVCVEVPDDPGWDFVPYPAERMAAVLEPKRKVMQRLKNSFWFSHAAFQSKAQVYYGSAYDLPESLGPFGIGLMGSILLHSHSPLQIVEQCARRCRRLIITDMFYPDLEGAPVCRLNPTAENFKWGKWWHFSTDFFVQFLGVLGFGEIAVTTHHQIHRGRQYELFTITAVRAASGQDRWQSGV